MIHPGLLGMWLQNRCRRARLTSHRVLGTDAPPKFERVVPKDRALFSAGHDLASTPMSWEHASGVAPVGRPGIPAMRYLAIPYHDRTLVEHGPLRLGTPGFVAFTPRERAGFAGERVASKLSSQANPATSPAHQRLRNGRGGQSPLGKPELDSEDDRDQDGPEDKRNPETARSGAFTARLITPFSRGQDTPRLGPDTSQESGNSPPASSYGEAKQAAALASFPGDGSAGVRQRRRKPQAVMCLCQPAWPRT